ncbi:MAG: hypothetical protein AAFX94_03895 [Myxococcota bacterium]
MTSSLIVIVLATAPSEDAECDKIYPFVIDYVDDSQIPLVDRWQIHRDGVPVSDSQVLQWADAAEEHEALGDRVEGRGSWVYTGLGIGVGGITISSVGWLLYGQDNIDQGVSLTLALGGLAVGIGGLLVLTEAIQRPLDPFLAPSPIHSFPRGQAQDYVYQLNRKFAVCQPTLSENRPQD